MRTFLRFLKPYKALCAFTLFVMALDVVGTLYIPTLVADMINIDIDEKEIGYSINAGL